MIILIDRNTPTKSGDPQIFHLPELEDPGNLSSGQDLKQIQFHVRPRTGMPASYDESRNFKKLASELGSGVQISKLATKLDHQTGDWCANFEI